MLQILSCPQSKRDNSVLTLSQELFNTLQLLTCHMYQIETAMTEVNDLSYSLFCVKKGNVESWQLTPWKASLWKNSLCANFQAATWHQCLHVVMTIPSPIGNGWCWASDGATITIDQLSDAVAPKAVIQLLSCKCPRVYV